MNLLQVDAPEVCAFVSPVLKMPVLVIEKWMPGRKLHVAGFTNDPQLGSIRWVTSARKILVLQFFLPFRILQALLYRARTTGRMVDV